MRKTSNKVCQRSDKILNQRAAEKKHNKRNVTFKWCFFAFAILFFIFGDLNRNRSMLNGLIFVAEETSCSLTLFTVGLSFWFFQLSTELKKNNFQFFYFASCICSKERIRHCFLDHYLSRRASERAAIISIFHASHTQIIFPNDCFTKLFVVVVILCEILLNVNNNNIAGRAATSSERAFHIPPSFFLVFQLRNFQEEIHSTIM
jgi:hypothetical protein